MLNDAIIKTEKSHPFEEAIKIYELAIEKRNETEDLRSLSPDVLKLLKESGLFRLGLPKSLGGWEDNPVEVLKTFELLSSAEASVGWCVWNNHLACTFGRFLTEFDAQEIYSNPKHIYANSTRPEGMAKIVDGGYMVSGRWTLVSGCEISDWFVLRCLVTEDGLSSKLGPGAKLKLFYIPKNKVRVIDTWHVGGLKGTGSHNIIVEETFVKESYAVDFNSPVSVKTPYSHLPIGCVNAAGCASIALGILKSTIDDLVSICYNKITPGKNTDLRDRLRVQRVIAISKATYKAFRSQLHNSVNILWNESLKGNEFTNEQLADIWSISCEAASSAREQISNIYAAAGTVSLYANHKIERNHRDIHAVLQHGIIQPHWINQAGMAYLGLEPTGAMFKI